jgi:glutamate racemase
MSKIKIGVFDSGVGALSVIRAIQKELPELEIIYKDDKAHVPYGSRRIEEIHSFIKPIFREFMDEGCRVVVVACNTVTTNLITQLRREFSAWSRPSNRPPKPLSQKLSRFAPRRGLYLANAIPGLRTNTPVALRF